MHHAKRCLPPLPAVADGRRGAQTAADRLSADRPSKPDRTTLTWSCAAWSLPIIANRFRSSLISIAATSEHTWKSIAAVAPTRR
jgi:hypothetical protein